MQPAEIGPYRIGETQKAGLLRIADVVGPDQLRIRPARFPAWVHCDEEWDWLVGEKEPAVFPIVQIETV